jgi:hypothetical protein
MKLEAKLKMAYGIGAAAIAIAFICIPSYARQSDSSAVVSLTTQPQGKAFAKPENAAAALYAAARRNDEAELLVILGPDAKEIVNWTDDINARADQRARFAEKYAQMHRLKMEPDHTMALYVGSENWPLPIPLVEYKGSWYFDADLGMQEIRYRRIGRNEMEAVEVGKNLIAAEKEYHAIAHQYTAKFVSADGTHDGLYWKSADDSTRSPIGPYLAHAGIEPDRTYAEPFHGYNYRIILQGSDNFAVVAFPAMYHASGAMTFLVTQDGTAYEKDFGDQTAALSKQMNAYEPDTSWKKVE